MMFQSTPAHDGRHVCQKSSSTRNSFQSTPAHDGRRNASSLCVGFLCFNPRPHTTGDRTSFRYPSAGSMFQSTPAHDGRLVVNTNQLWFKLFQSTPAHDGRRARHAPRTRRRTGFNPRPHTTGDIAGHKAMIRYDVSIHARTRRATWWPQRSQVVMMFQSTPAHDGRRPSASSSCSRARFNPRPHTTGDLSATHPHDAGKGVSIHARTRRATPCQVHTREARGVSIHARTRRATFRFNS